MPFGECPRAGDLADTIVLQRLECIHEALAGKVPPRTPKPFRHDIGVAVGPDVVEVRPPLERTGIPGAAVVSAMISGLAALASRICGVKSLSPSLKLARATGFSPNHLSRYLARLSPSFLPFSSLPLRMATRFSCRKLRDELRIEFALARGFPAAPPMRR
jgi:hypothetical protein